MEIHYKIIGILLITLALAHIFLPSYFKWEKELKALSLINQQIMKVHTFFIALTVFLIGFICLTSTDELINTPLGQKISLGFGIFWAFRLLIQFFWYSSKLWRGKKMETAVHISFSILWFYLSFIFLKVYFT